MLGKFAEIDLHHDVVSNSKMGDLYEELIRRFSKVSDETAGEQFTLREVIQLMVNLLFIEDDDRLAKPGIATTLFDPGVRHRPGGSTTSWPIRHSGSSARR